MHSRPDRLVAFVLLVLSGVCLDAGAEPLDLILPTSNDALLHGDGPSFYMYTDRYYNGRRSRPWEAGQYGFVRNPRETSAGLVYTRFHEGVDIQPVYRSASGEPLDTVRVVDDGVVVYANDVEARSSYGKYVVVEHWWSGAPFYTLYAHLNAVHVDRGDYLRQGDRIGRLGYTGRGINRRRAHLHFEINMLLNQHFGSWYDDHFRSRNYHGDYNGFNLAGLDVAALYLAMQEDRELTIDGFLASQQPFFRVMLPNEGVPDLLYRYPWLTSWRIREPFRYAKLEDFPSWEIWLTASGLPLRIEPASDAVRRPTVTSVEYHDAPYSYLTSGTLTGSGPRVDLASEGERYLRLLTLCVDEHPPFEPPATLAGPAVPPVDPVGFAPPSVRPEPQPVEPVIRPVVHTEPARGEEEAQPAEPREPARNVWRQRGW